MTYRQRCRRSATDRGHISSHSQETGSIGLRGYQERGGECASLSLPSLTRMARILCANIGSPFARGGGEGGVVQLRRGCLRGLRPVQRPDGVAGEVLVDDHASDAHHGGAAVVALSVQLEILDRGVGVAHPWEPVADCVSGLLV